MPSGGSRRGGSGGWGTTGIDFVLAPEHVFEGGAKSRHCVVKRGIGDGIDEIGLLDALAGEGDERVFEVETKDALVVHDDDKKGGVVSSSSSKGIRGGEAIIQRS